MIRFTGRAVAQEKGKRDVLVDSGGFTTIFVLVEGITVVILVPKRNII